MKNREHILKNTAGLILTVFVFLFLHSDVEIFHEHTKLCKDIDLCVILDKANLDNKHNCGNAVKLSQNLLKLSFILIREPIKVFFELEYLTSIRFNTLLPTISIKQQVLRI